MDLQAQKVVAGGYVVSDDDNGWVLLATGDVTFPFGLPEGFYVTIVNLRGGTVNLLSPGVSIHSPTGATALATIYSSATVLRLPGSQDLFAFGL